MYSIKKVSDMLGIPVVTIRAWENRHHIITPKRSEGGHRIFSEEDIDKLRFLKLQIEENGVKISEAVRLLEHSKLLQSLEENPEPRSRHTYERLIERLYEDITSFNTLRANETIDLAFSLYDFEAVFHHILLPELYRIGTDWEAGLLTVAQEHFASQLIMHRFFHYFRILPVHPRLPRVLAFCPVGEHHHIGLMLFSLFLRKKGVDVIYLGPDTPFLGLSEIIEMKKVSIILISATSPLYTESLPQWIEASLLDFPALKFVLGGPAFDQKDRRLDHPSVSYPSREDWETWYQTVAQM